LLLVSREWNRQPNAPAFAALYDAWLAAGRLEDGSLVRGGFSRLWLDNPGFVTLYANQQGGFQATCPRDGSVVTAAFSKAVQQWRGGGERAMSCPSCAGMHSLEALPLRPPGAFARGAVIFTNVNSIELGADVIESLHEVLGFIHVVVRRAG
jgi:hypothetical protein